MLSPIERLLFALLVAICLTAAYTTFKLMADIVMQGQGQLCLDNLFQRLVVGAVALLNQGRIIRHRRLTSIFHYLVAFGFIFYGLVNLVDVLEALIPGFFIPGVVGDVYRLVADIFGFLVLVGVAYMLIRRFIVGDHALKTQDNVKVDPNARIGIPRDSLVVGGFILLHIGFRLLGQSFHLAEARADSWQPIASVVANWFGGWDETGLLFARHASWWISVGLVVMFIPYFPYTKHAHLFMGPLNFMTRPERKALGALEPLNFEDESIEQFGAAALFDLHKTHVMDAFACIMCNRCQEACPAYATGKELSPAAIEINKRYYLRNNMVDVASGQAEPISLFEMTLTESALWACTTCFDAVLDMRMDQRQAFTAAHILKNFSETQLHKMFEQYGEVTNAKTLAKTIFAQRSISPIRTINEFKAAVHSVVKGNPQKYFAQVFQAFRIEVNDELGALKELLEQTASVLHKGGRIAIITFHSLEDRLVKNFFRSGTFEDTAIDDVYGTRFENPFKVITKKPVVPSEKELKQNNRSRSAKLRVAELK